MLYWALMFLVIALVAAVFRLRRDCLDGDWHGANTFRRCAGAVIVSLFAGFLRRNL